MIFHRNRIFRSEIEKIHWVSRFYVFCKKKQRNFSFFHDFCQKMKKRDFRSKSGILGGHSNVLRGHSNALRGHSNVLRGIPMFGFGSNWADFAVFAKSDKNFERNWKCNTIWSFLHFVITFLWFVTFFHYFSMIWLNFYDFITFLYKFVWFHYISMIFGAERGKKYIFSIHFK